MSRTYRFRHDEYVVRNNIYEWRIEPPMRYGHRVYLDPRSSAGRRLAAMYRSGKYIMHWHGPRWFRRETAQAPYRVRAKRLIHNYMRGRAEDVILESKPHLGYWY